MVASNPFCQQVKKETNFNFFTHVIRKKSWNYYHYSHSLSAASRRKENQFSSFLSSFGSSAPRRKRAFFFFIFARRLFLPCFCREFAELSHVFGCFWSQFVLFTWELKMGFHLFSLNLSLFYQIGISGFVVYCLLLMHFVVCGWCREERQGRFG